MSHLIKNYVVFKIQLFSSLALKKLISDMMSFSYPCLSFSGTCELWDMDTPHSLAAFFKREATLNDL